MTTVESSNWKVNEGKVALFTTNRNPMTRRQHRLLPFLQKISFSEIVMSEIHVTLRGFFAWDDAECSA